MNILDSSVVLAYLRNEKGGDFLTKLAQRSRAAKESIFIHQINFIEVVYKVKSKLPDYDITNLLAEFSSPWWGKLNYMDSDLMILTAELKAKFPQASLGDSIGLATAKIFKAVFWTADSLLAEIGQKEHIKVELIR
jgi:predicted nucleic acid-binding protein